MRKTRNKIIEHHGDWLLLDISTKSIPDATMAIDTDVFIKHTGGRIYAHNGGRKYIRAMFTQSGRHEYFHRYVMNCKGKMQVDHICHGTESFIDNRISNLRLATNSQNAMNGSVRPTNRSGHKGVCMDATYKKWKAYIMVNNRHIHLGRFDSLCDAVTARKNAEQELFGEYSYERNNS